MFQKQGHALVVWIIRTNHVRHESTVKGQRTKSS